MPFKSNSIPVDPDDPICVVSYVIASTRVGGGPEERPGFWPAYWEALEFNEKTHYKNNRIAIVRPLIAEMLGRDPDLDNVTFYYRNGCLSRGKAL